MGLARVEKPIHDVGFVETSLGKVRFRAAGGGVPVLLFHINRQSSDLYRELMDALAPRFTALGMDYPSYGESEHASQQPSIEDYAACGRKVLDHFGFAKAIVVGEAVGSAVASAFACAYPTRTAGVVLLNVPMMPDAEAARALIGQVRDTTLPISESAEYYDIEAFLAKNGRHAPLAPTLEWIQRVKAAHAQCGRDCWQAADALIAFDLKAALSSIRAPVFLLTGEFSPFADFRATVEARLAGVEPRVIPRSRFAIGWEKAREVACYIGELADRC